MESYSVLIRPILTEKTETRTPGDHVCVFEVHSKANKHEIHHAVEQLFGVKVLQVRTLRMRGKRKRFGRHYGKRANWKKAYVTLAEGNSIDFFGQ